MQTGAPNITASPRRAAERSARRRHSGGSTSRPWSSFSTSRRRATLMSWYSGIRARLRAVADPRRADDDLRDEIRHHLELETEANIKAGMSGEEARRLAVARFGGVESVREQHRDVRRPSWLADFVADSRFAV